jgi:hypothetical protein
MQTQVFLRSRTFQGGESKTHSILYKQNNYYQS